MKRPQSAKLGQRRGQIQHSYEDFMEDEYAGKNQHRNKVKIMKPDLTTNDFARVMPKKIYQDKERLYSEGLQLKQALNELMEDNVKLKTRISILEKEKDKMNKYIQSVSENANKTQSRLNIYAGSIKSSDKENIMVRNLKKMIRDSKEENDYLKQENSKIKKAIKYTKINQLEIQRKMLLDENQRLNQILVELNNQLANQEDLQQEVSELKGYLEEEVEANKELSQSNQKYLEYIDELEDKLKKETERAQEKEKKLQRELALQKRKVNQSVKLADELRREIRTLRQSNSQADFKKKSKPLARPVSSHPYTSHNRSEVAASQPLQSKKQMDEIKNRNQELQSQLRQVKLKLEKSEAQLKQKIVTKKEQLRQKDKTQKKITTQQALKVDSQPKDEDQSDQIIQHRFILKEDAKVENDTPQPEEDNYEQEFEKEEKDEQFQSYKKDFEEESGEAQQIFKKEKEKPKKSKGKTEKNTKSKKKGETEGKYKPDKKLLTEIRQLLTYRMKAHRYPFSELEKDILQSQETEFTIEDLEAMLKAEPFFLKQLYVKTFMQYAFESEDIPIEDTVITNQVFLKKIRKFIDDFELVSEKQEEQMLLRIAEMTTTYPGELEAAFQKVKNGPDTISKAKLVQMFRQLELADHYIDAIIVELSLCSEDLEHLNFHGFFERFYIEDGMDPNAIDEQAIQSSGEEKTKIHKIDEQEQYEDDKVNFIMDDEGELSMGMQGANNYEDDIVSDDGHI